MLCRNDTQLNYIILCLFNLITSYLFSDTTNRDRDSAAGQSTSGTGASGGNEVVIISPGPDESSGDEELATPMFSSTPIGQLPIAAGEEKRAKAFVESLYESVVTCCPVAMEECNLAAQAVEVGTVEEEEEEDLLVGAEANPGCGPAYNLQMLRRLMVAW